MRMISNKHVFGGSMKRFKRIPFVRRGYVDVPAAAKKTDEADVLADDSVVIESELDAIPTEEHENEYVPKKNKIRKHKIAEGSQENNEVKTGNHE